MTQELELQNKQVFFQKHKDSYYYNGCTSISLPNNVTGVTWKTDTYFEDFEYCWLAHRGKSLGSCCPSHLRGDFDETVKMISAHLNAFKACGVSKVDFSLLPQFVLDKYMNVRNKITDFAWNNRDISIKEYNTLKNAFIISDLCRSYSLNFNISNLKKNLHLKKYRNFLKILPNRSVIDYNIFGTKTGRFSTNKDSFPILNLDKNYRNLLVPNNDLFLVLDYNGAETRTLLALNDSAQPDYDIHEFNRTVLKKPASSRQELKEMFFAWLYNPDSSSRDLEKIYDKKVYKKYYDNKYIVTPFGRKIEVDEKKALNYLIQSTTNDIVIESTMKIKDMISGSRSQIAFLVHDSLVIDVHRDDVNILNNIINEMEKTRFGKFKCNVSLGKNYGELKEIK